MSEVSGARSERPRMTLSDVLRLLELHTQLWFSESSLSDPLVPTEVKKRTSGSVTGDCVVCYNNLLRGETGVTGLAEVRKLAGRPFFYRLNYIRQLSTTHLAVNLDGAHNRLSHSLGTLDMASRFVSSLEMGGVKLLPEEIKAVLVYAFVHDCFHGPMGHSLDLVRDVFWGTVEERVDKHLLLGQIDILNRLKDQGREKEREKIPLWKEIRAHVAEGDPECEKIFKLLSYFADYSDIEEHDPSKAFLREIVDSDLDADRLDYIWRDHVHLTMTGLDVALEIEDLIESVKVLDGPGLERHLHYGLEHKDLIDKLLSTRVKYYANYYEHPIKTVSDEMLSHAMYYALDNLDAFERDGDKKKLAAIADRITYLTDDELLQFLTQITTGDDQIIASSLLRDFRLNRPFHIVDKKGLLRKDFGYLTRRIAGQQKNLDHILDQEEKTLQALSRQSTIDFDHKAYRAIIAKFNDQVSEPTTCVNDPEAAWNDQKLHYIPDEDVYHIQLVCGDGFRKKFRLEKMLWQELLREMRDNEYPFRNAIGRLAIEMAGSRRGNVELVKSIKARLEYTPLVFITLSWMPGISSEQDLLNHKRGLSQGWIRFHDKGQPVHQEPELEVKSGDLDYFLLISAPSLLLTIPGIKTLITETFERLLYGRAWVLWQNKAIDAAWD